MRVLIGCEESGVVRTAFANLGHDAWSNDLIESRNGIKHYKCCVKEAIADRPWDVIILHPPCTALAVSGNRHYGEGMLQNHERHAAKAWTKDLWELACSKAKIGVAMENPVGVLWAHIGVKAHYVQPYEFGHLEQKNTGFALHNLPKLIPTNNVYDEMMKLPKREREKSFYMAPSADRAKLRSETKKGIAEAMAQQWGK